MQTTTNDEQTNNASMPTVAQNAGEELVELRTVLERMAHDLRMKTKGAGEEMVHTRRALEAELKRFSTQVSVAADETRDDLQTVGRDLKSRMQKLANQIAIPSS